MSVKTSCIVLRAGEGHLNVVLDRRSHWQCQTAGAAYEVVAGAGELCPRSRLSGLRVKVLFVDELMIMQQWSSTSRAA